MTQPKTGRPEAPHGKSVIKRVPIGCLAEVILVIKQYKAKFMVK